MKDKSMKRMKKLEKSGAMSPLHYVDLESNRLWKLQEDTLDTTAVRQSKTVRYNQRNSISLSQKVLRVAAK